MKNIIENEVGAILTDILDDYKKGRAVDKMDIYNQPDKTEIMDNVPPEQTDLCCLKIYERIR